MNSSRCPRFQSMFWRSVFLIAAMGFSPHHDLMAQVSYPDRIEALEADPAPKLDGILAEDVWQKAEKVSDFTQRERREGEPATEIT